MVDQYSNESSSTSNASGESSNSTVQINIKTLDSQIYNFEVDKNMPVSTFKEKIANEIGVPVGQQRLIFRGKVLKDDHPLSEYHVENGHTLHLVVRQPAPSSAASTGETSGNNSNQGNDSTAGAPRNRSGHISHSVVLGTFNVADQGESVVPDLTRVIGAVLNSIGIGGQTMSNLMSGTQSSTLPNAPGQAPQRDESEGMRGNAGRQSETGNQAHTVQAFPGQAFQNLPQVLQIPVAAAAIPVPSINAPIPDSLDTLAVFMSRMEQALQQNGISQNPPSTNLGDQPRTELPSNTRGLPTPEALSIVLRHAQRLLNDHAVAALSRIAGRLEQDGWSSDSVVRSQIQAEAMQLGFAMQHLGALFLELGRTILTLRMGQSPAESIVNAGPAVYVSPSGPNPMMVQPFPLQTSSIFGGSVPANFGNLGPASAGNAPRHINIHIHAGTSLAPVVSAVGTRANNEDGTLGERSNGSALGNPGSARVLPMRNFIGATGPFRTTGLVVPSGTQPGLGVSASQFSADSVPLSSVVAEIDPRIRNVSSNTRGVQPDSAVQTSYDGSHSGTDIGNEQPSSMQISTDESEGQKPQLGCHQISNKSDVGSIFNVEDVSTSSAGSSLSFSSVGTKDKPEDVPENKPLSSDKHEVPDRSKAIPLGLGPGGLDRKRRIRQLATSSSLDQDQHPRTSSQQALQALASRSSVMNRTDPNEQPSGRLPHAMGQMMDSMPLGERGSDGQLDISSAMSQVLRSPALNGLLAGVSQQTGVGSPDVLRNMLQQLTQSPQMRNTVNEIAEQVDSQNLGNLFAGMGRGQGGGIDVSRMFQQMMPIVSQALSGVSNPLQFSAVEPEPEQRYSERNLSRNNNRGNQSFQIDLQQVVQRIESLDSPRDVFRSIIENAAQLLGNDDLVNELCSDESLADEYIEILHHDLCQHDNHES